MLNAFGGGGSTILCRDTTVIWDASGEPLTFPIDGNPSLTAQAPIDTTRNILVVRLHRPSTIMGAFMNQLRGRCPAHGSNGSAPE